ncbi:hypothetical protein [Saccharothrix sp. HUAS TT1]|uniref:hypothetical protein n=1 Tax=unclassified Saccharothrix TaxID=2593673 RepID=UPI00345BAC8E
MTADPLPGHVAAGNLRPGTTVVNCNYSADDPRATLDVASVTAPDADLMVLVHVVDGPPVPLASDWPLEIVTPQMADLFTTVVHAEAERLADLDRNGGASCP